MTYYLISFPASAMQVTAEELPAVAEAARAAAQAAKDAGVLVFAAGLSEDVPPAVVGVDGSVTAGTYPQTEELDGGFTVVDVPSRDEALEWAARIAVACRCGQEVREFVTEPLD